MCHATIRLPNALINRTCASRVELFRFVRFYRAEAVAIRIFRHI